MKDHFLKARIFANSMFYSDHGQGLTEYALAFSLIALGTVAGQSVVAHSINHTFIALATTITTGVSLQ